MKSLRIKIISRNRQGFNLINLIDIYCFLIVDLFSTIFRSCKVRCSYFAELKSLQLFTVKTLKKKNPAKRSLMTGCEVSILGCEWNKDVKANVFNDFFTRKCNTFENNSTLPNHLLFENTERISSFDIFKDKITKIIGSLDPNKAHRHHGISIHILKLCASSISKPLFSHFKHILEKLYLPKEWKKANIVSVPENL